MTSGSFDTIAIMNCMKYIIINSIYVFFYLSVLRIHKSNINTKLNVKLSEKGMSWKTANVMKGSYFSTIAEKNHVFKTPNNIIYPYDHVLVSTIPNISILVCYFITWKFYLYYRYLVLLLHCWEECNLYDN